MFIKSIKIRNYRSFKDSGDIPLTQSATFLGPNGAGKSNVLKAIRAFYDVNAVVTIEDFFNRDSGEPISISIVFHNLNSDEVNFFGKFVQDNILSVEKKFTYSEGASKGLYFGQFRQHEAFSGIRALAGRERINAYSKFRQEHSLEPLYQALPTARSGTDVDQALTNWEESHQDQLQWVQAPVPFFGARNIGGGSLDNFTRFVFVPAVREATLDASESKGGALGELLSILVKEVIFQREDLLEFRRRTVEEFRRLTAPERLPEIPTLEQKLTTRLRAFVPQSSVHLSLGEIKEPAINFPETKVELTEDNFRGLIEGKGHGLQRSFIISIIQELAIVQAQRDEQLRRLATQPKEGTDATVQGNTIATDFRPDLILAIEEPELFQHPIRQRHFSNVLAELTSQEMHEGRPRVQVIMTTHSPYFVSIKRFQEIREVIKEEVNVGDVASSRVTVGDPEKACTIFCAARGIRDPNTATFLEGLRNIVDPHVSEAFFARCVIVVEGPDDRAAVEAGIGINGIDCVQVGIPVISVDGKCNIARMRSVLNSLGISSYVVFDCDGHKTDPQERAKQQKENKCLFDLCGFTQSGRLAFPEQPIVSDSFACFPFDLEHTLEEELTGIQFLDRRNAIAAQMKLSAKNPAVYKSTLSECYAQRVRSKTLDQIAAAVKRMARLGSS